jgi:hypothetical protein
MLNKLIGLPVKITFGIIFMIIITPLGLIVRSFGIDFMQRKIDRQAKSYWNDHL